jgi:hypothetical protein
MSAPRQKRQPVTWSVVRGGLEPSNGDTTATSPSCTRCGRATADMIVNASLSVAGRDGRRRFAPPMPLCDTCRRDVLSKRAWLPTWCAECQSWRPFGHEHIADLATSGASAVAV